MQLKGILFVFLFTALLSFGVCIQDEDIADNENGNYVDVHQHPRSGFSCTGKKAGEYYADPNTNCQLYYVCLPNAQLQLAATSFACPNTTRFNQATRVCSPADQVYCRAEFTQRFYENVHGNIDSKDQRPNEYLPEYFDKTPWQLNRKPGKALIVPLPLEKEPADYKPQPERPRPAPRTAPKIEAPKPDSPLHSSFALSFNSPQNPRVVARTRASTTTTTNSRRGNALDLIPAINNQASSNRFRPSTSSQNSANSRTPPRFPAYSAPGRVNQPQAAPSTPSTTTTTTTPAPVILPEANLPPKPSDPKSNADYVYDYVYEDAPAGGQPSPSNNKPPALPALPSLDDATSPNRNTNAVSTLNTNLGALFGGAIGQPSAISSPQQPPQLPKLSASSGAQRPPARSQIPQPNGLNFFNSNNPFHSNPFASNPFSSSNTGSLIRQKRANEDEAEFSCHDKLVGIGYADVKSLCKSFYICLPLSKGKYKKYELFCDGSYGYNQLTAQCEPLEKFDCKRSPDFYLYNKQANMSGYLKNRFRIAKQLAEIKN